MHDSYHLLSLIIFLNCIIETFENEDVERQYKASALQGIIKKAGRLCAGLWKTKSTTIDTENYFDVPGI